MRLISIIGISFMLLTGCVQQQVAIRSECILWKTMYPSRTDVLSEGTTRQLIRNNTARDSWCNEANHNEFETEGESKD